jgi:hypothetical protein
VHTRALDAAFETCKGGVITDATGPRRVTGTQIEAVGLANANHGLGSIARPGLQRDRCAFRQRAIESLT